MADLEFEFDEQKSLKNRTKHGIDFVEAQALWDDDQLVEGRALDAVEARFLIIGRIGNAYWPAIITYREIRVRLISVRLSRITEIVLYESRRV